MCTGSKAKTGSICLSSAVPRCDLLCAGDEVGYDLYARFFGPWVGTEEDPVTGSAYTVAAPYFSSSVFGGKQQMLAKQCSARGGTLQLDLGSEPGRVVVSGLANMGPACAIQAAQL
jgi:predicted PhzF superfamily epimerase YddE/YHI9